MKNAQKARLKPGGLRNQFVGTYGSVPTGTGTRTGFRRGTGTGPTAAGRGSRGVPQGFPRGSGYGVSDGDGYGTVRVLQQQAADRAR